MSCQYTTKKMICCTYKIVVTTLEGQQMLSGASKQSIETWTYPKSEEEIRVRRGGNIRNGPVGQNEFKRKDVVKSETVLIR